MRGCSVSIFVLDNKGRAGDREKRRIGVCDIRPFGSLANIEISVALRVKLLALEPASFW